MQSPHALSLGAIFLFVLGFGLMGPTHFAFAQDPWDYAEQFTEVVILFITEVLQGITAVIGKFSLMIIEMIIVPILQYNGFSSSPTIGLGWKLVRDVINMFVVLVLLVIAIATIVGYEKASWQKNLPQFLLAVILVNFSRTICGFLIDISQVVMFTFVNALLDVAAGNFAVLLNFDDFGQYARSALVDPDSGEAQPIMAMQQLGAAYLLFILYACICAVLLLLALVYIWRIVVLWVLVILSPMTFFTWGLGGMFKFAAGAGADWWKKFTAALVLGPMLTFFLWLALATGTGDIVDTENFELGDSAVGNTLESLETSNMLATFLGLVLLVVGMQQSAATANSLGGVAKKYLGDAKGGENLVKGAISWAGGYTGSRLAGKAVGQAAGYGIKAGEKIGTTVPLVGGFAGRQVINAAGYVQQKTEGYEKAGKDAAKKRIAAMTDEQKAAHLSLIAAGRTGAAGMSTIDDIKALQTDVATNAGLRKKNKENMPDINDDLNIASMKHAEKIKDSLDDAQKDKVAKFKSEQAHLLKKALGDEALEKHIQSDKFNARDLSKEAASDKDVLEALKKKVIRTNEKGEPVTAYDELIKGVYGKELAEAAKGAGTAQVYDRAAAAEKGGNSLEFLKPAELDDDGNETEAARPYTSQELASNINARRVDPEALTPEDFSGANGAPLTAAVIDTDSIRKLSNASRDAFVEAMNRMPKSDLSTEQRAKADHALMESGKTPMEIGLMPVDPASRGDLNPEMRLRIDQVISTDINSVRHLQAGMPTDPNDPNDVTAAVVENITADKIRKLGEQAAKATGEELESIRRTMDTIAASLRAERATVDADSAQGKKLDKLSKAHRAAARYVA